MKSERGYTLVEVLAVLAIIAISTLIAVANSISLLADYRLRAGTQQVASAVQLARASAISSNFSFTFTGWNGTSSLLDTYQVTGGENDGGNGLDAWEDRNRNGMKDEVKYPSETLPKSVRYIFSQSISPAVPVNGNPGQSTANVTFNPLGIQTTSTNAVVVYLQNEYSKKTAVTIDTTGRVQTWQLKGSQWVAL